MNLDQKLKLSLSATAVQHPVLIFLNVPSSCKPPPLPKPRIFVKKRMSLGFPAEAQLMIP